MSDEIQFYAVRTIVEGKNAEFTKIANEAAKYFDENCPGTVQYQWYIDEETNDCHLFEHYSDNAACLRHLEIWGQKFSDRIKPLWNAKIMVVGGTPNAEVKDALKNAKPVYCDLLAGYSRFTTT